ncbi:MAG: hypothetical protein PHD67_08515 [Oscillospiraceae bacterium]|nr:hypothetical protein [Oscillospiraceae bacterium]
MGPTYTSTLDMAPIWEAYNAARETYLGLPGHTEEAFLAKTLNTAYSLDVQLDQTRVSAVDAEKIKDTTVIKNALVAANPDCAAFVNLFEVADPTWDAETGKWHVTLKLNNIALTVLDPIIQGTDGNTTPNKVNFSMPGEILQVEDAKFEVGKFFDADFHFTGNVEVGPFNALGGTVAFSFDEQINDETLRISMSGTDPTESTTIDLTFTGSPIIDNKVSHKLKKDGTKKFTYTSTLDMKPVWEVYNTARETYLGLPGHTEEAFLAKTLNATYSLDVQLDQTRVSAVDAERIKDTTVIKAALVAANPDCEDFVNLFEVTDATWDAETGKWHATLKLNNISLTVLDPIIRGTDGNATPNKVNFSMPAEILRVEDANFKVGKYFDAVFHITGNVEVGPFNALGGAMAFSFDEQINDESLRISMSGSDRTDPTDPTDPADPTNPTKPTNPSKAEDNPNTGGSNNFGIWPILIMLSATCLTGINLYNSKKRENNH